MSVFVRRYKQRTNLRDTTSPELYYLQTVPGTTKTVDIRAIASQIETLGSLSAEDVTHVLESFVRKLKENLTLGNRVKVDGLGTFYTSFNTLGTAEEKDCTVKNIYRVNIRFLVNSTLRLVNDSIATTRKAPNNVVFTLQGDTAATGSSEGEEGEGGAPN